MSEVYCDAGCDIPIELDLKLPNDDIKRNFPFILLLNVGEEIKRICEEQGLPHDADNLRMVLFPTDGDPKILDNAILLQSYVQDLASGYIELQYIDNL